MSRIYQYPVVTEIGSDDYLALGSTTNGSRAILASDLAPVIGTKTITERGTYKASDDDMDGYGQVTVDIPYTDIHVASGDIATFEGEDLPLKSLKATIVPVQDLHGYDAPWAGGAGKNKFGGTFGQLFPILIPSGTTVTAFTDEDTTVRYYDANQDQIDYWHLTNVSTGMYVKTFTLSADAYYFRFTGGTTPTKMYIAIENSFSGFAPYSNICPISGWDEAVVNVRGVNWCGELESGTWKESSAIGTAYDDMKQSNNARIRSKTIVPVTTPMTISIGSDYQYALIGFDANGGYLGVTSFLNFSSSTYTASTWYGNGAYIAFVVKRNDGATMTDADIANCHLQIELGSTATTYSPYNGATYTIDLDGTIYGGDVEAVSGGANKTFVKLVLDGTQSMQNKLIPGTHNAIARYTLAYPAKAIASSDRPNAISDKLKPTIAARIGNFAQWSASTDDEFTFTTSTLGEQIGIAIPNSVGITDTASFNTWLSNNPITIVYELATPITVQLAPTAIKSLEGTNNIFADCGPVDVEYQTVWVRPID